MSAFARLHAFLGQIFDYGTDDVGEFSCLTCPQFGADHVEIVVEQLSLATLA
jgi:hypothetical protein